MEPVSVADLKANLSHYLAAVRTGKEITITSHRHAIARLVPLEKSIRGLGIMPASKPISLLKKIDGVSLKFDPVDFLLEDRQRR